MHAHNGIQLFCWSVCPWLPVDCHCICPLILLIQHPPLLELPVYAITFKKFYDFTQQQCQTHVCQWQSDPSADRIDRNTQKVREKQVKENKIIIIKKKIVAYEAVSIKCEWVSLSEMIVNFYSLQFYNQSRSTAHTHWIDPRWMAKERRHRRRWYCVGRYTVAVNRSLGRDEKALHLVSADEIRRQTQRTPEHRSKTLHYSDIINPHMEPYTWNMCSLFSIRWDEWIA